MLPDPPSVHSIVMIGLFDKEHKAGAPAVVRLMIGLVLIKQMQ
jgi:hypothetical protein